MPLRSSSLGAYPVLCSRTLPSTTFVENIARLHWSFGVYRIATGRATPRNGIICRLSKTTMDDIGGILLLVCVVIVLPWLLWLRSRHLRVKAKEEFDQRWNDLSGRVPALERSLKEQRAAVPATHSAVRESRARGTAAAPVEEAPLVTATPAESPAPPFSAAIPVIHVSSLEDLRLPSFATVEEEREPSWFERLKGGFDLEEALGTNWLNKIRIVILVFGIAFFLAYQLRELGPAGKDLVGFVVSGALLGGGLFLERKPGYSLIARAGVGGGWGLAFFTTYALYHVSAARILSSQGIDLVLMGAVAAAMVAH